MSRFAGEVVDRGCSGLLKIGLGGAARRVLVFVVLNWLRLQLSLLVMAVNFCRGVPSAHVLVSVNATSGVAVPFDSVIAAVAGRRGGQSFVDNEESECTWLDRYDCNSSNSALAATVCLPSLELTEFNP